jgi:hypothetical protein
MSNIGENYEWRRISDFVAGDFINRWGDDFPVTQVQRTGVKITLFYMDTDNKEKGVNGRESAEYLAKKRP